MPIAKPCPTCGDEFYTEGDREALQGACPRCLARQVLDETTRTTEDSWPGEPLPSLKTGIDFQGYEILDELGRGGMGVVYRARQKNLGRRVALKILSPRLARSEEFARRFRREAKLLAALNHPNVVRIYDSGEAEGLLFLGMEFVEGSTLQSAFDARSLPPSRLLTLLAETCEGLEAIHRAGLVHRDLKPANLMITPEGLPKIADFGLAVKTADSLKITETGAALGTPSYMSPEQVLDQGIDRRSDLYSLGIILYQGLTNRLPFDGPSPTAVLLKQVKEPPPPPRQFVPDLPAELEELTLRLLSKDPAGRPGSAQELRGLLERAARNARIRETGGDGSRASLIRWAVPALVVALAALLLFTLFPHRDPAPASKGNIAPPAAEPVLARGSRDPSILDFDLRKISWSGLRPTQKVGWDDPTQRTVFSTKGEGTFPLAVFLPGDYDIVVAASGEELLGEGPRFKVMLDGRPLGDEAICDPAPKIFRFRSSLGPSNRSLGIAFTNPGHQDPDKDRILYLYGVRVVPVGGAEAEATDGLLPGPLASAADGSVNVLRSLQTQDHALQGEWIFDGAYLVPKSAPHQRSTLALPVRPPEEYDLRFSVLPLQKPLAGLEVGLVSGASRFVLTLDGGADAVSGLSLIDGKDLLQNGTRHDGVVLRNARENLVTCEVRKNGVTVRVNGTPVASWAGTREHLSLDPRAWNLPDEVGLFFSSRTGRYRFSSVVLTPVGSSEKPSPLALARIPPPADLELTLQEQGGRVRSVAFSADGARLISGGDDGVLRLWDVRWGRVLRMFESHGKEIAAVAWSSQGPLVCSGSADRTAIVWNVDNGRALLKLAHDEGVTAVAFSPDGRRLLTGTGSAIKLWDSKTGELLRSLDHGSAVRDLAFSRDGQRILSAGAAPQGIRFWDPGTGMLLASMPGPGVHARGAVFTPDGSAAVAAFGDDTIRLWDLERQAERATFTTSVGRAALEGIAQSPDGKSLVYCRGDAVLIDAGSGRELQRFPGHQYASGRAVFSPDGKRVATCGGDGTIGVWIVRDRWSPVFDGASLGFARPGAESAWRISEGALVPMAGSETNPLLSDAEFGDGELRIRFEARRADGLGFRIRQGDGGSVGVSRLPTLKAVNEIVFRAEGDDVTATLNGNAVLVEWDRRPRSGRLQIQSAVSVEGLRILAIEARPLTPAAPREPVREGWTIAANPSVSRGMKLIWNGDGDYATEIHHKMVCFSLLPNPHNPNRYLYAAIQDRTVNTTRVEALVDYFDEGTGEFGMEYDAVQGAYYPAYEKVQLEGSGVWKTARFTLMTPVFRGRQNGRSDLRLVRSPGAPLKVQGIRLEYHKLEEPGPLEGSTAKPDGAQPGVRFEYFEGHWESVTALQTLLPVRAGVSEIFDLSKRRRNEDYGLRFTGYLEIPRDGRYTFSTSSDDGSTLMLGKKLVVANDGLHGLEEQAGIEELRAGVYPITVQYFQARGGTLLEVFWSGPGIPKQIIPASALTHVDPPK